MTDTFRKKYRPLTDDEKGAMEDLKVAAEVLENIINETIKSPRDLALAKTKLEESVMWAIKGLTK